MIKIENLTKQYGTNTVLRDLSVEFDKGNVYGIVGDNGAGKTTLFRCIVGLETYSGKIISLLNPLKNHVGLLLPEQFFFSKITGQEYIRLLCNARGVKIRSIDENNIFDLPLNQYAATYSTGMKKKLALTAILLQRNEIFVLDEPFNGVDIHSNMIITEIIHKLKEAGKTILISSHIFSTLSDTCDRIHHLHNGTFIKTVQKSDFSKLESEMKLSSINTKLERLFQK